MTFTFTLETLFGVLALAGIAVLVALFMALLKGYEILKQVKTVLIKNEGNINQSIESLSGIVHNIDGITASVNEEMEHIGGVLKNVEEITEGVNQEVKQIKGTIRSIEETVEYAAATAQSLTEDFVLPIGDLLSLLSVIKGLFVKEKKKGLFRK